MQERKKAKHLFLLDKSQEPKKGILKDPSTKHLIAWNSRRDTVEVNTIMSENRPDSL